MCSVLTHAFIGVTAFSVEASAGEVKLGVIPKTSLFHINDSDHYDLMSYQKFLHTPLSGTPQKCFQSGPALANAGPESVCWRKKHPACHQGRKNLYLAQNRAWKQLLMTEARNKIGKSQNEPHDASFGHQRKGWVHTNRTGRKTHMINLKHQW